jgi:hypothetical protein
MKIWSSALALLCIAGLSACSGTTAYAPQIGNASQAEMGRSSLPAPFDAPQVPPAKGCTAPPRVVPGKYIAMFATGTATGATFTSVFGQWSLLAFAKSAAASSSTARRAPAAAPPSYLYAGTYTMTKTKKKGCVLFLIGQNVQPLTSAAPSNGVFVAAPQVQAKNYKVTIDELGILSLKLTGLNAAGGRGTATLYTQALKPYDTATIVLGKRTRLNSP